MAALVLGTRHHHRRRRTWPHRAAGMGSLPPGFSRPGCPHRKGRVAPQPLVTRPPRGGGTRPRRKRLGPHHATGRVCEPSPRRLQQVQAALHAAVDRHVARRSSPGGRNDTIAGVRVSSLHAALDAFAHAVLTTDGSISVRHWAERAGLDPKTVRRARDAALKLGILECVRRYTGGEADCDAFTLSETAAAEHNTTSTSPTLYTPSRGQADTLRLQSQHQRDMRQFALSRNLRAKPTDLGCQRRAETLLPTTTLGTVPHLQRDLTAVNYPHFRDSNFLHRVDRFRRDRDSPSRPDRREGVVIYRTVDRHGRNAEQLRRLIDRQETRRAHFGLGHHRPPHTT